MKVYVALLTVYRGGERFGCKIMGVYLNKERAIKEMEKTVFWNDIEIEECIVIK